VQEPAAVRAGSVTPPLPGLRDPWFWLSGAAVLLVVLKSLGAPLGEPAAEDFDFLHSALLLERHGIFEGGGSLSFWRPLAHQAYYSLLGGTILTRPGLVALLHTLLLGATALLLYRALRRSWSGPIAAAAATFPLLMESSRELIAWPSHFVDLGAVFFAVLALHEASCRRIATALAALLASLLCKEAAVVTALLLPWMPLPPTGARSRTAGERMPWIFGTIAVVAIWGLAYAYVRRSAGLELPHGLESNRDLAAVPWATRLAWSLWNSLRAVMSLPGASRPLDWIHGAAVLALAITAAAWAAADRGARQRLRGARAWVGWGMAWFLAFASGVAAIFPFWAPYRAVFGAVGLGIAAGALLGSIHPGLLAASVALRALAFAASPGVPALIRPGAPETGDFVDFQQLVRIQRLMRETRTVLEARLPSPAHGTRVGWSDMPRGAVYAFGGDRAIQVWYRDTTLRWVNPARLSRDSLSSLAAIVQYQLEHEPAVAIVEPRALQAALRAEALLADSAWSEALPVLADAESLQKDATARVFRSEVAAKRARCLMGLARPAEGVAEARRALRLSAENPSARYLLAADALGRDDVDETRRQLDTLIAFFPGDTVARRARDAIAKR